MEQRSPGRLFPPFPPLVAVLPAPRVLDPSEAADPDESLTGDPIGHGALRGESACVVGGKH